MQSRRNTSAPQLSATPPSSPRGFLAALGKLWHKADATRRCRAAAAQLSRLWRRARYWNGWVPLLSRTITVLALASLLALGLLFAKCALFPTDNPREEWVPARWGVPWSHSSQSWAALAARRKAQLLQDAAEQEGGQEVNITSLWARLGSIQAPHGSVGSPSASQPGHHGAHGHAGGGKPPRLKYPVLWAAPFFSRSGERSGASHPRRHAGAPHSPRGAPAGHAGSSPMAARRAAATCSAASTTHSSAIMTPRASDCSARWGA